MDFGKVDKDEILDDFNVKENFPNQKIAIQILIHLIFILGIYFSRDYYVLLFVETSENQDNWLKIISWIFLITICIFLTKQIFKKISKKEKFRFYQIPVLVFLTFLAGRIIFLSTTYLVLGARVKYPDTPIYYFQGLMVAGLFGFISYNRTVKFKSEKQLVSIVLLVIYYLGIMFINSQIP